MPRKKYINRDLSSLYMEFVDDVEALGQVVYEKSRFPVSFSSNQAPKVIPTPTSFYNGQRG
jgi:hypothetical protein